MAEAKEETVDKAEIGTSSTIKKLWEGRSAQGRLKWLTEPPEVEEEDEGVSELLQHAITLQYRDIHKEGKHKLHAIIIRNPQLQEFLSSVIPNASSFYDEEERGMAFHTPFRLLFWHMDDVEAQTSEAAILLREVLRVEFRELLTKREELLATGEMNFSTVWTIFKPGITCLTNYANDTIAVKVDAVTHSTDPMGNLYIRIKFRYLKWDGEHLGWDDSYEDIIEFPGRRRILDLDIFPLEFRPDVSRLASRGRRFLELCVKEPHMMSFSGETLDRERSPMWWQGEQNKKLSERVVLDARAYNHYFRRFSVTKWLSRERFDEVGDDVMYCCPDILVFALQRKKWTRVWIDDLDDVVFNDSAYPSLVLPHDYKELLLAFAEAQIDGYGFDDVIAGKGQGILMLLAGPPGVGKTLTAEAVAEHMKRPLYSVSAGELGASPHGMEHELDKVLELSTRWNSVLLLDEADVFLEKRQDSDLARNTIVSVFLRKLEYYRGIMFLTTNRIGSFDEAFKSRIHIAIKYPELDKAARRQIWENFLNRTKGSYRHGVSVTDGELELLSQKVLNGREIRNIIKSAQLLASRANQPLQKKFLDIVCRVEHEESAWKEKVVNGV